MNERELQIIERNVQNTGEKLTHVLSLLSHQETDDIDKCIALARDLLSEAANEFNFYMETLVTELKIRIEHRGIVVPVNR